MPWERYFETGAVAGSGSRSVMVEQVTGDVVSAGGQFNQVLEDRAVREYAMESPEREEGAWVLQGAAAGGGERDLCAEAGEEVADSIYHEGNSRPVRRVEWDLCGERPLACGVERGGWGPGDTGVPYPTVFLQSNVGGLDCLPVNRLLSGRGPAPWIAHLKDYTEMAASLELFIFIEINAEFSGVCSMVAEIATSSGWSPADIPTIFWYDASDAATITFDRNTITNTDEVTEVRDKSGNNITLARLPGRIGPVIGGRTLNGLNVFEWNGNNGLENTSFTYNQNSAPLNLAMIVQIDDTGQAQHFIISGRKTTTAGDRMATRWISDQFQVIGGANTGANAPFNLSSGGYPLGSTTPRILLPTYNGSQSEWRVDGAQKNTGTVGTNSYVTLRIGKNEAGEQDLDGYIAEMVGFSNNNMREKAEGYLAWKWGLQGILPASHPYKNFTP